MAGRSSRGRSIRGALVRLVVRLVLVTALVAVGLAAYRFLANRPGPAYWGVERSAVVPTAQQLTVYVKDDGCAGGVSAEERVGQAKVVERADAVVITFEAKRLEGESRCPSHAAAIRTVVLTQPLGGRELLDGGTTPPVKPCLLARNASGRLSGTGDRCGSLMGSLP